MKAIGSRCPHRRAPGRSAPGCGLTGFPAVVVSQMFDFGMLENLPIRKSRAWRTPWPVAVIGLALVASLSFAPGPTRQARGADAAGGSDLALATAAGRTTTVVPKNRKWRVAQARGQGMTVTRASYSAAVQVKALRGAPTARVQIRQVKGRRTLVQRTVRVGTSTAGWRTFRIGLVSKRGVSRVQVRIKSSSRRGLVARVSQIGAGGVGSTSPRRCVSHGKGLPSSGAYAGAAVGGTISLASREAFYGRTLGVHRTYWSASQVASSVRSARADVAAKRVPWISYKTPGTWRQVAAGTYDAWALGLIKQLDAVPGPVWLAFWHEPENDNQPIADWTRMQTHLMRLVKAHSDNIAKTMIVMGWWQVGGDRPELKLPRIWPGDGLIDVIGMDPYNVYGVTKNGKTATNMSDVRTYIKTFSTFARAHGARWGVAETAYTDQAAAKYPGWITNFYQQLVAAGGVAMAYFDTTLENHGRSWPLTGAAKRAQFAKNMQASPRIC
jgi:hypothetical protein